MATTEVRQCKACGGIYRPVLDDGMQYFHACPTQKLVSGAVVDQQSGKVVTAAVFTPLANRRDENVVVDASGKATVKLGDPNGFTAVTDVATLTTLGLA
jgi:hypothetical protein